MQVKVRIGIDVGGTNTDAALMRGDEVICWVKTPTTQDVTGGVLSALEQIMTKGQISAAEVGSVMIGTTHFTNAVVQRRDLAPTAVVRLGLPATASLPPMVDWPDDLARRSAALVARPWRPRVRRPRHLAARRGGAARHRRRRSRSKGIRSVAVSSVFSPVRPEIRAEAGAILAARSPGAHVTLSSDIGRIGLLERENAAIMNACLRDLSRDIVAAFREALRGRGHSGAASTSPRTTAR